MLLSCVTIQAATESPVGDDVLATDASPSCRLAEIEAVRGEEFVVESERCLIEAADVLFIPQGATVHLRGGRVDCFGTIVFQAPDSRLVLEGVMFVSHRRYLDLRGGRIMFRGDVDLCALQDGDTIYWNDVVMTDGAKLNLCRVKFSDGTDEQDTD